LKRSRHWIPIPGIALIACVVLCASLQFAQTEDAPPPAVSIASPLGDMILGSANAPVTIVEYASMSCTHCAAFHDQVYPKLRARYIDAGKVRLVFREFPLDITAAAGSMLARCLARDDAQKYFSAVDVLFRLQNEWAFGNTPDALKRVARQMGLGELEFQSCLANEDLLKAIKLTREDAIAKLNVKSTPTFFVNGVRLEGEATLEELSSAIEPQLGN
jgi:protein-disulfide isomerase